MTVLPVSFERQHSLDLTLYLQQSLNPFRNCTYILFWHFTSLLSGGGGRGFILVLSLYSFSLMIRFICLVELVSAVFQFSFNFWISNCLPFSVGVLLSFLSKYSGQQRYQTRIQADCIEIHIDLAPSARLFLQRGPPFFFVNHLPCLLPCDSPWVKL